MVDKLAISMKIKVAHPFNLANLPLRIRLTDILTCVQDDLQTTQKDCLQLKYPSIIGWPNT